MRCSDPVSIALAGLSNIAHSPAVFMTHAAFEHATALRPQDLGRADGREPLEDETSRHLKQRGAVGIGARNHRMDKSEIIHNAAEVGENFRDPVARLAVLFELERRFHDRAAASEERSDRVLATGFLAVMFVERRLAVEAIDMAKSARQENHDHVFRFWREVPRGLAQRTVSCASPIA